MQKEEIKNIPGLDPEKSVVIWKMNYGFQSDLQGEINELTMTEVDNKTEGKASVNVQRTKLYNLVYGILESVDLAISQPKDLGLGLSQEEKQQRLRVIRNLDRETGDYIFKKIGEANKVVDDKTKKNLNTSSMVNESEIEKQIE